MYRTIIKRDGLNPLTGDCQYRTESSEPLLAGIDYVKVIRLAGKRCGLLTPKRYQPNTFINPRRAIGV